MRILHIIDSGGLYGAEIMLLHLMEAQLQLRLKPILASIGTSYCEEKPIEDEARRRGLDVEVFRMRPGPNWCGAFDILRFARSEGIGLLHSHGYKGNIIFGLLPKRLRRLPLVTTVHGWTWTGGWNRMWVYEWLDGLSLRSVDRVVLVNEVMKTHPRVEKLQDGKVEVIVNGIPWNNSRYDGSDLRPEIIQFAQEGFSIVTIGRLSPEKGFAHLVEAVAELVRKGRQVRLAILGQGGLREDLEKKVRTLGIADHVHFFGYIENAKDYLGYFNLFCMPSLTEGLPLVLLEAMAAGVPIVASCVGGIPEALDNGYAGLLVRPGDAKELKTGILDVMKDSSAAAQRAGKGVRRVREIYSSEAMARRYLAVYEQLLSETIKSTSEAQSETKCL